MPCWAPFACWLARFGGGKAPGDVSRRFEPEKAFVDGSFGLELAPLKYFLVMWDISNKTMELQGGERWPQRFGFIERADSNSGKCVKDAPGNLPLGFSVSNPPARKRNSGSGNSDG